MRAMLIDDEKDRVQVSEIRKILKNLGIDVPRDHLLLGKLGFDEFRQRLEKITKPPQLVIVDYKLGWKDSDNNTWNGDKVAAFLRDVWPGDSRPYILCVSNKLQNLEKPVEKLRTIFALPPCGLVEFVGNWEAMVEAHIHCAADRAGFEFPTQEGPEVESITAKFIEKAEEESQQRILGQTAAFRRTIYLAAKVANAEMPVLLSGARGSGKRLFASAIHANSARCEFPIKTLRFSSQSTIDDATLRQCLSHGGTLLLDGIECMSGQLQEEILDALRRGEIGSALQKSIKVNARIISLTTLDIADVEKHLLLPELFRRLNQFPIRVPDLYARQADIEPLAINFLGEFNRRERRNIAGFSLKTMRLLRMYTWPGNIAELGNVIGRAAIATDELEIRPKDLPDEIREGRRDDRPETWVIHQENAKRAYLERIREEQGGNVTAMARVAGIDRASMSRMLGKLGMRARPASRPK